MADNVKKDETVTSASGNPNVSPPPAPGGSNPDKASAPPNTPAAETGEATPVVPSKNVGDKTYYLKEGAVHHHIVKGENRELNQFGDEAVLNDEQYKAFQDKFLTEAEYKAQKAGRDTLREAQAAQASELPPEKTPDESKQA